MSSHNGKLNAFACEQCRASKRRCDGAQPQCSTCEKSRKDCQYITEKKPRKRKYWDESYVKSLENQVQALLALQSHKESENHSKPVEVENDCPSESAEPRNDPAYFFLEDVTPDEHSIQQSNTAMEEMSVMMWRTNLADAVPIQDTEGEMHTDISEDETSSTNCHIPPQILSICGDSDRIYDFACQFFENINQEHQFTAYESADVFLVSPSQTLDRLFLHSALLAAGATFDGRPDSIGLSNQLAELSESLVFKCFRQSPSIYVIQGLIILSWRSLALGHDHFGWTFLSMAAGLAVHLRLHVLALGELESNPAKCGTAEVQTFWSFYMTDRTSISILGRNCMLPWRRVNVPPIETLFPSSTSSLAQLSFAWQCRLWYMHDQRMDEIFSLSFEDINANDQAHLLLSTQDDLNKFLRSHDPKLNLARGTNPKPVLLFHMSYQMALLLTMPPFLRLFAKSREKSPETAKLLAVVLQSLTSAATSMLRLVQEYCKENGFQKANPLLIHHLLSASIVHLMNTTSKSLTLRRYSTRSVRRCLYLLSQFGQHWTNRCQKSAKVIKTLASRWNVESVLPSEMSSMEDGFSLIAPATFDPPEQEIPLATTHEHDTLPSDLLDLNDPLKNLLDLDAESATQGLFQDGEQIIGDFSAMEASFLNTDDTDLFEIFEEFRNNTQQESHWLRGL